jgi:hypothetical protein
MDEEEEEDAGNEPQTKKSKVSQGDNEEEEDDDDDGEEEEESVKAAKAAKAQAKADKEAHDLAKVMMSKKASRLYGRMQRGISAKQAKVDEMARRRKELEDLQKPRIAGKIIGKETNDGQTPLKQKVIRLKNERRKTEKEYSETGGSMKKSKKRRTE